MPFAEICRVGFVACLSLGFIMGPIAAPAAAGAHAESSVAGDPAATLARLEQMLQQIAGAAKLLRAQASAALEASQAASDLDAADQHMRLYAELISRAAEIDLLGAELTGQVEMLRSRLEEAGER